ncbi:MAG TPA: hypothetical protein VNO52_00585, partial [Methylomirabilota bacterium]|nr:hypothetical protein [Methylomirabilota bacterium]
MLDRLGLQRPKIATKLYGIVALTLAVVCALASATILFAIRTRDAAVRLKAEDLAIVARADRVAAALARQRRLVAAAAEAGSGQRERDAQAFEELSASLPALLHGMGLGSPHEAAGTADDARRLGLAAYARLREGRPEQAAAAAGGHADAVDRLERLVL